MDIEAKERNFVSKVQCRNFFKIKIVIFMPKDLYKLFQVELICQGDDKNVMKKGGHHARFPGMTQTNSAI